MLLFLFVLLCPPPHLIPSLLFSFPAHLSSLCPSQPPSPFSQTTQRSKSRQKSRTVSDLEKIHFQFLPKAIVKGKERLRRWKNFISKCVFSYKPHFPPSVRGCLFVSPPAALKGSARVLLCGVGGTHVTIHATLHTCWQVCTSGMCRTF